MTNTSSNSHGVQKIVALLGVIIFCYIVNVYSRITLISSMLPQAYVVLSADIFERHFWQFIFGFIAIAILSRGHLWSYGINSQNLKSSMQWLGWLYAVIVLLVSIAQLLDLDVLPIQTDGMPRQAGDTMLALLIYWMSSPVANQILFFGFGQTVLMKQFGDSAAIAGVPVVVIISSVLFALFGIDSAYSIGSASIVSTFVVGIFSGIVYWKTNSLIAPMLGHAFVFGFPLVVELISL